MKIFKRFLAALLCFALILPSVSAYAFAFDSNVLSISNGFIEAYVSTKNGGFLVKTAEGDILRKSDNNKDLLYHSSDYDTSFVSFRVESGTGTKDYLFGGKYPGASAVSVTQPMEGGDIIAVWSVDGITFTQTVSLAIDESNEHGMVCVSLAAQNDGSEAKSVKARILLDTCLGEQDYAYYQVQGGNLTDTIATEQILRDEASIRSFYAVDDIGSPQITAYVVSEPYQAAIGHWNDLASTLFDFAPDASLNFTNPINDYLTADSACAMYYDLGTLASGQSQTVTSNYGVYSNHNVDLANRIAVNTVAPLRLMLNDEKTVYERQSEMGIADFAVTVSAENYASDDAEDLTDVILAVRSTNALQPLGDTGNALDGFTYDTVDPLTAEWGTMEVGQTITKQVYFKAKPLVSASYERITIGFYKDSVTSENLLGEKRVYVLLPGSDGNIPKVSFTSMTPTTIYSAGTRHLYVAVTNENMLMNALEQGTCTLKAYRMNSSVFRDIPADAVTITDGIADIALTEDIQLAKGSWFLQLEWTDEAVSQEIVTEEYKFQTAPILQFQVSDDPKYRNDCYGVLAAVKYGKGTNDYPYYYRLENFRDEAAFQNFAAEDNHFTEILLVFRGEFTADNRYLKKNEDGKTVGALYYTAVSKKTVDPNTRETTVTNGITINDCLDFEGGTMSVYYEDYGSGTAFAEQSPILVEFDGDLYTSDARTSVWTGKAALTKLEQGENYSLIHYDANGKRKATQADPITLIWPNVYGLAQTLAGMAFKLAYGQFGVMENSEGEIGRTVSFAASLSLKFMSSGDEDDEGTVNYFGRMKELWTDWRGASIYQYAYHGARFEKLTDISMNDTDQSGSKDKGVQASVMVQDILFGCGQGLVGLNFTVDVGVKNMIDSLPKLTGKLSINTINNWSFGLAGSCKMSNKLNLEAKLSFKSYKNVPIPDEIYFFIGGFNPGLNIDGAGVVWITGGGGGISNLYDTIFCKSGVPPLKLIIAASFSIIQVLDGNAKLTLALTGLDLTASDLKIFGEIEAIKKVQLGLQWYPDIKIQAGIYVSMFEQVIEGQGYIVLIGKNYTDWFFEMFIQAALKIPASVPLVGGMTLVGAELGVSTKKIWGAFEALKLGIGVTYYWGESTVHFGTASDKAQPTYPNLLLNGYDAKGEGVPVAYDAENDRTLYARFGTNFEAPRTAQVLGADDLVLMDASGVWSDGGRVSHKFNLGSYNAASNAAAAVQFNYEAESLEQAKALASGFTVKDGANAAFPLALYDGANADSANANVTWDEATGTATFAFTVTDESQYDKDWFVSTGSTPADVVLYNVLPLPELTGVSAPAALAAGGLAAVTWDGTGLDELDNVSFFLAKSMDPTEDDGVGYPLTSAAFPGGVDDSAVIQSKTVTLTVPADIPAGDYYLRAVYAKDDQVNGSLYGATTIAVSNANMPAAIGTPSVSAAGDLRYGVEIPQTSDANTAGYSVTIYDEDGSATDIAGLTFDKAASGATSFEIGGSYTAPVRADADNAESALTGTAVYGLEGGKNYSIGITPYKTVDADGDGEDDTIVYGAEYRTAAIALPEAVTPTATLTAEGKTFPAMTAAEAAAVGTAAPQQAGPAFTASDLTVTAAFSEPVSGTWTLDSSDLWETMDDDAAVTAGTFENAASAQIALTGLAEGDHTLTLEGSAADGDRFAYEYPFTVDTTAPRLLLSAPLNGSPFNADGTVTIAGVTDHNATLFISVDGQPATAFIPEPDMAGVFSLSAAIPQADGAAAHKLTIYAADPLGNRTADKAISLVHPGLGDLQDLILKVDGTVPANGAITTETAGTAALSLWGVTSDGKEFALDPDRIQWRAIAAEGAAAVGYGGALAYEAFTKGFVEAMLEVTEGAYRTASLALYAEAEKRLITASAGEGGSVSGGGYYEVGERAFLLATPDEGYSFDHWEVTGATVADATSAALSFVLTEGGDITARAVFRVNEYTITWKNYDGSIIDTTSVGYGSIPSHAAPERPGDAEHTYTFAGWTPELVAVTGPATYTATFTDSTNVYTITWQDEDGQLIDTTTVAYGAVPTHEDPAKKSTAEYTYTFAGWTPELTAVTGPATYKATFTAEKNSYLVTWKNDDGSTIDIESVEYGAMPSHADPAKSATAEFTYAFAGWSPAVETVTGDATYTATYTETRRNYTVTWNVEGVQTQETYAYGETPVFKGTLDKAPTEQYSYTFTGWSPAVEAVTGDASYTAQYSQAVRSYTITWKNDDGSVIDTTEATYGSVPEHAAAVKEATDEFYYTFAGWTPALQTVRGDATYTATYTEVRRSYVITWLNEDGTLIDTTTVVYGAMPGHAAPTKPSDAEHTYTFAGWTPEVAAVTGPATYRATFTDSDQVYTITWKDEDGSVIDTTTVAYGAMPSHVDPAKEATAEYTYTFAGWTPALQRAEADAAYTAVFTAVKRTYTITWLNEDGTLIDKTAAEYGSVPAHAALAKAATEEYTYVFAGWTPEVAAVTGEATYKAVFTAEKNAYTVTWNVDGKQTQETYEYGETPVFKGSTDKPATAEYSYTFDGWTPEIAAVTGDATYTAQYSRSERTYDIRWLADDGSLIDVTSVKYGAVPAHADAVKAQTAEYTYVFAGWTPALAAVTGEASYTATFRAVRRSYTVTWIVDGVESQETYEYGAMPSFKGTPEKADTAEYRYTFAGWTPEIASVTGDASYTAVFDETARKRLGVTGTTVAEGSVTVTFVNEIEPGAVAIVALYDESGRFIGIMTQELPVGEETPLTVPTEDYADPDTAGVFIVNADMKPKDAEVIILLDEDRP